MPFSGEEWFGVIFYAIMFVVAMIVIMGDEKRRKQKEKVYNRRTI